jgi:MFS transporter, DHA1 family, multidrug resistance protein
VPREPRASLNAETSPPWGALAGVLTAAFLFNLGQGALRPSLPLYLREFFGANYRMVTFIPAVFGAGKWAANLPTGYLLDRVGRERVMVTGLVVIAACDVLSVITPVYGAFLVARAAAGAGWAMFATVATTTMVRRPDARGRAISLLLMSETLGLLLGSAGGGWLYQSGGPASPFVFEGACMLVAAVIVGSYGLPAPYEIVTAKATGGERGVLARVLRVPGIVLVSITSAGLMAIQTGVLVFLLPLYLAERGHLRPDLVGYIIALSVVGRLVGLWVAGKVSDRSDKMSLLAIGLLSLALVLGSITVVRAPMLLAFWSALIGAAGGVVAGLPAAIVGDRVDSSRQGVAIGWLRTASDVGMLMGPLAMGVLADAVHLAAPFLCAAVLAAVLAVMCHRHAGR